MWLSDIVSQHSLHCSNNCRHEVSGLCPGVREVETAARRVLMSRLIGETTKGRALHCPSSCSSAGAVAAAQPADPMIDASAWQVPRRSRPGNRSTLPADRPAQEIHGGFDLESGVPGSQQSIKQVKTVRFTGVVGFGVHLVEQAHRDQRSEGRSGGIVTTPQEPTGRQTGGSGYGREIDHRRNRLGGKSGIGESLSNPFDQFLSRQGSGTRLFRIASAIHTFVGNFGEQPLPGEKSTVRPGHNDASQLFDPWQERILHPVHDMWVGTVGVPAFVDCTPECVAMVIHDS